MCGIFGFVNYATPKSREFIINALLAGLRRLEYRGYDSAGIAVDDDNGMPLIFKEKGNIDQLVRLIQEETERYNVNPHFEFSKHVGIAHTRWATHGPPSRINCHPQTSGPQMEFMVVHNGIITNYRTLKQMLESNGFVFESETDTEVIAKLSMFFYKRMSQLLSKKPSFASVATEVVRHLEGAFACLIKSTMYPGEVVAAKRGSPLLVGLLSQQDSEVPRRYAVELSRLGAASMFQDSPWAREIKARAAQAMEVPSPAMAGEQPHGAACYVFASDPSAIVEHTKDVLILEDGDIVHVKNGDLQVHSAQAPTVMGQKQHRDLTQLHMDLEQIMKGNFAHFMLKEIHEQAESITNTMRGRVNFETFEVVLGGIADHLTSIRRARRILFIACGTSFNSAIATRPVVEALTEMPVAVENASDFLDRQTPIFRDDCCVFISQSGETADTLSALHFALSRGAICVGITNTVGSAIARLTHCGIHVNAGVEIGVASTKAYTSQIIAIIMLSLKLGEQRISTLPRRRAIISDMQKLPEFVSKVLQLDEAMKKLADEIHEERSLLLLGRGYQYATCIEGALKIKEIAYMHSEGMLAGELKHGPLALVDEHMPVLLTCVRDDTFEKTQLALSQILARNGRPIVLCNEGDEALFSKATHVYSVPRVDPALQGVLTVIPLQLLSYHVAVRRGHNVDQPRNLAKSVTVM